MKEKMKSGHRAVRHATRIVFVLLMLGLFALPQAHAQRGQRGPEDKEEYLNKAVTTLNEEVNLSEEQATQIRVILGEQFDKQQAARTQGRSQGRDGREAMREQMAVLRTETNERVEALLAEEQIAKYRAFHVTQQANRPRGRRGGGRSSK